MAEWRCAPMAPSWARWLPCAVAHLRVVADPAGFPRSSWRRRPDPVPWDGLAWCDPGDVEDWVTKARAGRTGDEAERAETHAREAYRTGIALRTTRATRFADMCRRQHLPVPYTVAELLRCLIGFGLFRTRQGHDGQEWIIPRLDRNPLDVLPLTADEMTAEAHAQHRDRVCLTGIALRKLAAATPTVEGSRTIAVSIVELATLAGLSTGQVRQALDVLAQTADVRADLAPSPAASGTVTLPWSSFQWEYRFDEPPAPEHAI